MNTVETKDITTLQATAMNRIIDAARNGSTPDRDDVVVAVSAGFAHPAAAQVIAAADALSKRLTDGRGYIYAQIGLDCRPCPVDCNFCSFAARYAKSPTPKPSALFPTEFDMSPEIFKRKIDAISRCNVDLVSLMVSAAYPHDKLLRAVKYAANHLESNVDIMVNGPDMSLAQAKALKNAGATCAYHAIRFGEGKDTRISPDTRRRTIENILTAGLRLMSGLEPLATNTPVEEIVDNMYAIKELKPFCTGVCAISPAKGTEREYIPAPPKEEVRYVAAILRLVCGSDVTIGCSGGVKWIDAGADPRTRQYTDDESTLLKKVKDACAELSVAGWQTPRFI